MIHGGASTHNTNIDTNIDTNPQVEHVFNKISECHFINKETDVCVPPTIVNQMKEFIDKKTQDSSTNKYHTNNPKKIIQTMKELLDCQSESCVLKRDEFRTFAKLNNLDEILDQYFKPQGPAHTHDLLSNFNIDDVLDQFEQRFKHKQFLHIPFQMRDFEKVGTQLATIDLADQLRSKYKTFGVVLNTDFSTGRGIHWFCLFGEKHDDKITLEYFNSSGKSPLPEVQIWLQKTKHYLTQQLNFPVEIIYSTGIVYQNDDHSCGVYVLAYIWCRLEGVPPNWFKADNFHDGMMHKLRKNLFRWDT